MSPRSSPISTCTGAGRSATRHGANLDGFDLIRQLRAEPRFAHLPILLISGDSDPRLPARALELGADAFFAKPYSPVGGAP